MLKNYQPYFCLIFLVGGLLQTTFGEKAVLASPLLRLQQTSQPTTQRATKIDQASDVIEKWTAEQHLYVKGELGISDEQLGELEKWLDENAPHWTIVLMQSAQGEAYRALDGRTFRDQEAVEYALGHGLANRTDFGRLTNSKTGETDGAVFVLFLAERKFSYYGSDIHDRRGIGESAWRGDLDTEAIRAMRNGGRLIDAVKATINTVHSRLEAKLAAEANAAQQQQNAILVAAIERRRELSQLNMQLHEVRDTFLPRIESLAREIRTAFPAAADSELANPSLDRWKKDLQNLNTDLAKINIDEKGSYQQSDAVRSVQLKTNQLRSDVDRLLDVYAGHKAFADMIFPVETRLDSIADDPAALGIVEFDEAYLKLKAARDTHARGAINFVEHIRAAEQLVATGEERMMELARKQAAEVARRRLIGRTLAITAAVLGLLTIGVLWLLNLRRRPALHRAHQLFERRKKSVAAELAAVDAVLQNSEKVLGDRETFSQKGFAGRTAEVGNQTLAATQRLKEMAREAAAVIENANQLLHPSNPIAEAVNMFSSARYEHCISLLNGESLRMPAQTQTPAMLSLYSDGSQDAPSEDALKYSLMANSSNRSGRAQALRFVANENHRTARAVPLQDGSQDASPEWQSFERFFGELRSEAAGTLAALQQVDRDLRNAATEFESVHQHMDELTKLAQTLHQLSRTDRLFGLTHLNDTLIPAIQSDLKASEDIIESDPMLAVAESLPAASRKIRDGLSIARSVARLRAEVMPQLKIAADKLAAQHFDTRWIGTTLTGMSDEANGLLKQSVTVDSAADASKFDARVTELGTRAKRCVELALDITQTVAPSLDGLNSEISSARTQIANALNLPATAALHEVDYNPDHELEQAKKQLQSARAALDYGGVNSVLESLQVIEIEKSTARNMIRNSLKAIETFHQHHQSLAQRLGALKSKLGEKESDVAAAQAKFAPSSLRLRRAHEIDETGQFIDRELTSGGEETILDWLSTSTSIIESIATVRDQISQLHFAGRVLEAENLLELVDHERITVDDRLTAIGEHCQQLNVRSVENLDRLQRLSQTVHGFAELVEDQRTQANTVENYRELESAATKLVEEFTNLPNQRDPLDDAMRMRALEIRGDRLKGALVADRNAHGEAQRAIAAAKRELETVQQSVYRSMHDRIPDSNAVKQCQASVATLSSSVEQLQQSLLKTHGDWRIVHQDATRLTRELGLIDGQLRSELQLAEAAVKTLQTASDLAYEASSWKGDFGIVVVMNPATELLERARRALADGQYQQSISLASAAAERSRAALAKARSQAAQERIRLQQEQARRRASHASGASSFLGNSNSSGISFGPFSSSSSSSSNSWPSSSSSSFSSSSDSSSSSSSFGSSGSGFSSSGW